MGCSSGSHSVVCLTLDMKSFVTRCQMVDGVFENTSTTAYIDSEGPLLRTSVELLHTHSKESISIINKINN